MDQRFFLCTLLLLSPATGVRTSVEIEAKVMYRHATTVVRSTMRNTEPEPSEVTFAMVMPEPALVSNFSILADGEENVALVMDRQMARDAYDDPEERDSSSINIVMTMMMMMTMMKMTMTMTMTMTMMKMIMIMMIMTTLT